MNLKLSSLRVSAFSVLSIIIGEGMNQAVVFANGQYMPVYDSACPAGVVVDNIHVCADATTHLKFLADRIHLFGTVYSLGDLFMQLGLTILFPAALLFCYSVLKDHA